MFRPRPEFYEKQEFAPGTNKKTIRDILDPRLMHEEFEHTGRLPEELTDLLGATIDKTNFRNPILFSVSTFPLASFIQEGAYDFKFPLLRRSHDEYSVKLTNTKLHVVQNEKRTLLSSINPESSAEKKVLKQLVRNEKGMLQTKELVDLEWRSLGATKNINTPIIADFDPEELQFINHLYSAFSNSFRNNKISQNYFLQMASLFLTGSFADVNNHKTFSGIKGILPDKSSQIIQIADVPGSYEGWNPNLMAPTKEEQAFFRTMLASEQPWFVNERFKKDIDLYKIIHASNRLGAAFRRDEEDFAVNIAAIATENIVSEVYECLKNAQCRREEFVDKLKYINKNLQNTGILDPFIHVYTNKKINPGNIRGEMVHVGSFRANENGAAYQWATEFYIDLAKTLLSAVGNQGTQYLEFDHFARLSGLVHFEDKSVAHVPKSMVSQTTPTMYSFLQGLAFQNIQPQQSIDDYISNKKQNKK